MGEIGQERRMKPSGSHGQGGSHSLKTQRYWPMSVGASDKSYIAHTVPAIAYGCIQCSYKVGHDGVGIVQAGEHRYDVGAWIRVFFAKSSI